MPGAGSASNERAPLVEKKLSNPTAATPNPSLNHRTRYGGPSWPGLGVRGTFSQPGPSRPTAAVRLARTLGRMKSVLFASFAAILVQPPLFFAWAVLPFLRAGETLPFADLLRMSINVVAIAATLVVLLGIPAFASLKRANLLSWPYLAAAGFAVSSAPIAVISWPGSSSAGSSFSATWHGELTELVVNGEVTLAGWLSYIENITLFGLHGLVGAILFLFTWRKNAA
jgi:hypothetical protein